MVHCDWQIDALNALMVADFTHVAMAAGRLAYAAFVVDASQTLLTTHLSMPTPCF